MFIPNLEIWVVILKGSLIKRINLLLWCGSLIFNLLFCSSTFFIRIDFFFSFNPLSFKLLKWGIGLFETESLRLPWLLFSNIFIIFGATRLGFEQCGTPSMWPPWLLFSSIFTSFMSKYEWWWWWKCSQKSIEPTCMDTNVVYMIHIYLIEVPSHGPIYSA